MRTHWDDHPKNRRLRLISLGEDGWWRRTAPPRHQTRIGFLKESPEYKQYIRSRNKARRERNCEEDRRYWRNYRATHPEQREKAAAARRKLFKENPGLAAYRTASRRLREKSQRCDCCSNQAIRAVYLRNGSLGRETDHVISLGVADARGWKGKHCVSNLQGLTPEKHRKKTNAEIGEIAAIRRAKGIPYHNNARKADHVSMVHPRAKSVGNPCRVPGTQSNAPGKNPRPR